MKKTSIPAPSNKGLSKRNILMIAIPIVVGIVGLLAWKLLSPAKEGDGAEGSEPVGMPTDSPKESPVATTNQKTENTTNQPIQEYKSPEEIAKQRAAESGVLSGKDRRQNARDLKRELKDKGYSGHDARVAIREYKRLERQEAGVNIFGF